MKIIALIKMPKTRRSRQSRKYIKKRFYTHKNKNKDKHRRFRGGSLGRIPASAIVSIQQDPYSARLFVDAETAEDVFEARGHYLL